MQNVHISGMIFILHPMRSHWTKTLLVLVMRFVDNKKDLDHSALSVKAGVF